MVFRTNKNAPNFRLIVIDIEHPAEHNWGTLIEVKDFFFCIKLNFSFRSYCNFIRIIQVKIPREICLNPENSPYEKWNFYSERQTCSEHTWNDSDRNSECLTLITEHSEFLSDRFLA